MIKLFGLIPKRPDLTDEQFHAHWRTTHKELALRIGALRGYVQSHRVPVAVPGVPSAPYEGISEVWLDDLATALGLAADPDYTENAKRDEPNFINPDRPAAIVAAEQVVKAGPPVARDAAGVKLMLLLGRADGVDPAALSHALAAAGARRVVVAIPVAESYASHAAPAHDAIVEASFADAAALERAWASAGGEHAASCALVVDELRVIWPIEGEASADARCDLGHRAG